MRVHLCSLAIVALCLLGTACSDRPEPDLNPSPGKQIITAETAAREAEVEVLMERQEQRFAALSLQAPRERLAAERAMGKELLNLASEAVGTRSENKALFWLASWQLYHNHGVGAEDTLARLAACPTQTLKQVGRRLKIDWLLSQGRVPEARAQATSLAEEIPEFSRLDLVAFHERVGQAAPRTAGESLAGGVDDPATRPEAWLLYVLVGNIDDNTSFQLERYLAAAPAGLRVVCVCGDPSPLNAKRRWNSIPGSARGDLLWANPNAGGDAAAWAAAWSPPGGIVTALLGDAPKRRIMAVMVDPDDLALAIQ